MNDDPRYIEAGRILKEVSGSIPTKLYKTTRAGATTGIGANCIDTGQRFCLIAPTRNIAHHTILDTKEYCNKKHPVIKNIYGNHQCRLNKEMVEKYPDVGSIPILPVPKKCSKCKFYNNCKMTEFLRTDIEDMDGVGITIDKIAALKYSPAQSAEDTIQKIITMSDVIIFDEVHNIETSNVVSAQIYPYPVMEKYDEVCADYNDIAEFIREFNNDREDNDMYIHEFITNSDKSNRNQMMHSITRDMDEERFSSDFKHVMSALSSIIDVMKKKEEYNLTQDDVLFLYNIIMVVSNDSIVIHYIKTLEGEFVYISSRDGKIRAIREIIMDFVVRGSKVIYTSATMGDYYYGNVFGMNNETAFMHDVMNTNESMTIYTDTFKLDSINYSKRNAERIIEECIELHKKYPDIQFVAMAKKPAWWLHKRLEDRGYIINVDYYGSVNTIGVSNPHRRCCCVGAPIKPINAFDGVATSYEESQKMRINAIHAMFYQTISRFKDPCGEERSYIHCIGIPHNDVIMMCIWGDDRKLYMDGTKCTGVSINKDSYTLKNQRFCSKLVAKTVGFIIGRKIVGKRELRRKYHLKADEFNELMETVLDTGIIIRTIIMNGKRKKDAYEWVN